jgi:subtilase family serine protease
MRNRGSRVMVGTILGAFGVAATLTLGAQSQRATLTGSMPPWATSSQFKTHADSGSYVGFRLYLGWQNASDAEARARAVSDPRSSAYRQFLTPAQFRQAYAPSQSSLNAVRSWLQSQGFSIVDVPSNNHYVSAEGTVAQAEAAFGTTLNMYSINGLTLRAPAAPLSVPASLGGAVVAVIGLDQSDAFLHTDRADAPPAAAFVNAPPCSIYWAQKSTSNLPQAYQSTTFPDVPCGYTPAQLQGAYGVAGLIGSGLDGSGQTVAILDAYASPTIVDDVNTYSALHDLPQLKPGQFQQVVAPGTFRHPEAGLKQDPQGWYGEETLDVEAVHSMAPGANIIFVGAPNDRRDLDAALNHVIDRGLAQIVTNSWGYPSELIQPGFVKPMNDSLIQAALEGIGVYFSSGDDGDEIASIGFRSVDWPPASPWVTAVGGTTLAVGPTNNYLFETGWGTKKSILSGNHWSPNPPGDFIYASGGGTSRLFLQPFYQVGIVPSSISGFFGGSGRAVPDVAMVGDPNSGMLEGQTQTFPDGTIQYSEYRIGGTSLSSPLFAGLMALADQAAGHPHGFANPALYALAASGAFRDIVSPAATVAVVRVDFNNSVDASGGLTTSLRTANQTGTLHTIAGYDDVTGLGTPIGSALISLLSQ